MSHPFGPATSIDGGEGQTSHKLTGESSPWLPVTKNAHKGKK
jgi:hypothetical protein